MIKAILITIGDELLIGQVIDTNSAWMAQELNSIGISVMKRIAVGDEEQAILQVLSNEINEAEIILITGGLGPTSDDITKQVLCKFFNTHLVENQEALENIVTLFSKKLKRPMLPANVQQAWVPQLCTPLQNQQGTAPGMMFTKNNCLIFSLPGVPFEMKNMMTTSVLPILKNKFTLPAIAHKTLLCAGIGESFLAEQLVDFEQQLPPHISLAYLPNYGTVRLRLSGHARQNESLIVEINHLFATLKNLVKEYLVTDEDETMAEVVAKLLIKNKNTVSTAESCTGGYLAHLLTEKAGASAYYEGSIISYSYAAKENLLKVPASSLAKMGAVSETVVTEMVKNLIQQFNTSYAVAVSGIMGPGGATPDKPIGTVWMAVANKHTLHTQCFHFRLNRENNIKSTAMQALNLLRQFILENPVN